MGIEVVWASLLTLGFLAGIRLMQSARTARLGNAIGASSMALAILFTLSQHGLLESGRIWLYMAVGAVAGFGLAQRVRMVHMPQMVGLFNGLGGAASAFVAALSAHTGQAGGWFFWWTAALALGLGTVTFSGSLVAALKLQGWIPGRPVQVQAHSPIIYLLGIIGLAAVAAGATWPGQAFGPATAVIVPAFFLAGIFITLRIGGADMPVVISLLNSMSGIAAAVCGLAVNNMLLAGVGALVGVAGMILTQIMCRAINRTLWGLLRGPAVRAAPGGPVEAIGETVAGEDADAPGPLAVESLPELLSRASKVIIVPGYGMAVAQAQHAVAELVRALEAGGKTVRIAIHPVAGRMPGHMNVLLAEAGLDYEKFVDMDDANPEFASTDVVIIVGACDVVNPAARTAEGTPIYGMPVLHVEEAQTVIVLNLDDRPGYSGVPNPLYEQPHVAPIWGDAKETVPRVTEMVRG